MWVQVQVSYVPSQVTFYLNALKSAKFRKIGITSMKPKVSNLDLEDFGNRFFLVNKIEIREKIYVELFAARIFNEKVI